MKILKSIIIMSLLAIITLTGMYTGTKSFKNDRDNLQHQIIQLEDKYDNINNQLISSINLLNENTISTDEFMSVLDAMSYQVIQQLNTVSYQITQQINLFNDKSELHYKRLAVDIEMLKEYYNQIQNDVSSMQDSMKNKIENKSSGYSKELIYNKMLYPTVRVGVFQKVSNGKFDETLRLVNMGSGTIIYSRKKIITEENTSNLTPTKYFDTYILTCSHLIDCVSNVSHLEIHIFDYKGNYVKHKATIVANSSSSKGKDIMILKMDDKINQYKEADFISKDKIEKLYIGQEVVNVGAGLGERSYPGFGYITGKYIEWKSLSFLWQTQSPGIFGNSGGPIFTKDGKQIGIVVRISMARGVPMPHMSYFVPPDVIYKWLESQQLDFILSE